MATTFVSIHKYIQYIYTFFSDIDALNLLTNNNNCTLRYKPSDPVTPTLNPTLTNVYHKTSQSADA